ncbi:MAG: AhpC/TSA family protein [Prolixibacteraceae bacterium]|nr:AhpC/TSA family protein [Prolixibacteraceae bacterium]
MHKFILFTALIFLAFSCKKPSNISVSGVVTNCPSSKIYLEKLGINGSVPFDSSKIDNKGRFFLEGNVSHPTFFLLKINNQKFITLLIDSSENVGFSADFISYSNDYHVEGSYGSLKVQELNQKLARSNSKIDSLQSLININAISPVNKAKTDAWKKEIEDVYLDQKDFSKKFINENPFSLASVLAIYQKFNDGSYIIQDLQTIKIAASALHSMYPESEHAVTLYEDTKQMMKSLRTQEIREFIEKTGANSPDIVLPDPTGKDISLVSLRGNVVLLHFWSAFDRNSRIMNPVLKENFKEFHPKGFEIYQICIDTSKTAWEDAIKADGLTWANVGDMKGSIQALSMYNVQSVPSNYLLDKDGSILAKDLKGPALYNILSEILN